MKKLVFLVFFSLVFSVFSGVEAGEEKGSPTTKSSEVPGVKYLEITIEEFAVWPINSNGKCFDLRNKVCLMYRLKRKNPPKKGENIKRAVEENADLKAICSSGAAPDVMVKIQIGKYETFITAPIKNKCFGKIGLKHTFRIEPQDFNFSVKVFDADGTGGVNIKKELMGSFSSKKVVEELIKRGKVTLGPFGQVEKLVLSAKLVKGKGTIVRCDGVYRVRLVEFKVKKTRENGKTWDRGFGNGRKPDVIISLKIGSEKLKTPQYINSLQKILTSVEKKFLVKKDSVLSVTVWDKDTFGKEKIGETLVPNLCKKLLSQSKLELKSFDRVEKVVLIFEKLK